MKKHIILSLVIFLSSCGIAMAQHIDEVLPVRGLAIGAPQKAGVEQFLKFVEEELAPARFNLLILRTDYNYAYTSHPELCNENPLSREDVKRIVEVCRKHDIEIVPQVNLLGHQSWAKETGALLRNYPQFDETPHINTADYPGWPNEYGLYCKSYCPLHPEVHGVVFALVDEIMEVFEAKRFHAGMDEVFYIGDDKCPRCDGLDKAELFAGEVTKVYNHLAQKGQGLMIWGDRLIDGKTTGMGIWEASMNNTHRAIDLIPKEVFICDWHYERPDQTAVLFAMKGFDVATCPWRQPEVTMKQVDDMIRFRESSTPEMKEHFKGIIATVWTSTAHFLHSYYNPETVKDPNMSDAITLRRLMEEYKKY